MGDRKPHSTRKPWHRNSGWKASGHPKSDWRQGRRHWKRAGFERRIVERDEKIAILEAQIIEAAKTTEMCEVKPQAEFCRIGF